MLAALKQQLLLLSQAITNLRMNDENRIRLYEVARKFVDEKRDASPNDIAPDELGCAESVNEIIKAAFGEYLYKGNRLSTYWLFRELRNSAGWKEVYIPSPGCIVISPTAYGSRKNPDGSLVIPNGHTGVVMLDGKIASNDSRDGIFRENYTLDSWADRYVRRGGYPMKYFRPL